MADPPEGKVTHGVTREELEALDKTILSENETSYQTGSSDGALEGFVKAPPTDPKNTSKGEPSPSFDIILQVYNAMTFIPSTAIVFAETKLGKTLAVGGSHVWKSSTYAAQRNLAKGFAMGSKFIKGAGNILGGVGIGITLYGMNVNGVTTSNSIDLIMGGISLIPGWGWIVGGIYFIGNAALEATTRQNLGQHIDRLRN